MKLVRVTVMYGDKAIDSYVESADVPEDSIADSAREEISVIIEELDDAQAE